MDVLAANAIIANIVCRAGPALGEVLDAHLDLTDPAAPCVPWTRQGDFRAALVTRLYAMREEFSAGDLMNLASAMWCVGDDRRLDEMTWRNVVRAILPYSLAAAPAAGRA